MVHLAASLKPNKEERKAAWDARVEQLILDAAEDLELRGLGKSRIVTFANRIDASAKVLRQLALGYEDPSLRTANQLFRAPKRVWSPQQQQVLDAIEKRTTVSDANELPLIGCCHPCDTCPNTIAVSIR